MTAGVDPRRAESDHLTGDPAFVAQQPPAGPATLAPTNPAPVDDRGFTSAVGYGGSAATPTPASPPREVRAAPRLALDKGESLYLQGDKAATAYLVESGLVALSIAARPGRERIVGLAGPGDIIGSHTEGQSRYLDSAAALSHEVNVVRIDVADSHVNELGADLRYLLGVAAVQHLERLTFQLEDAEVPVPARVARTFLRLAERFGQPSSDGTTRLTLPLTHDTLAAMVGAARETTSTTIEQLRRLGLVTGTRGRYVVRCDALRAFANLAACA